MNAESDGPPLSEPDSNYSDDGIEGEDTSSSERTLKPWDPAQIRVLGKAAFRRWPLGEKQQRGLINRAVFESQSIALADYPLDYLRAHKDEIMTAHTSIASTSTHFRASNEIPRVRREQGRPDPVLLKPTSTVAD